MSTPGAKPPRLTPEQQALARDHVGLVKTIAGRHRGRGLHPDDLESAANEALTRAATTYDPARGVPFSAYARVAINHACSQAIREEYQRCRAFPTSKAEDIPLNGPTRGKDPGEIVHSVREALAALPPQQREILEARNAGMTWLEISVRQGIGRDSAKSIYDRACETLRRRLGPPDP